jgi:hypothetical protein
VTREPIPQREALSLFLVMVAGFEPTSSYFEIRAKRVGGGGMAQDFISLAELERALTSVANRGYLSDTYLGVAPRTQRTGGLAAIERVWCLWVDCDSPDSLERLAAFRPLPSIVIRSGTAGHAHAYWPLSSAVPPKWAKRANQRLALALGADRNATDAARIMRPPLTLNYKHALPRHVVCTRLELASFTIDQVVGQLPDDQAYLAPAPRQPRAGTATPSAVLDGLARTVREATLGNRNAALYWAACRIDDHDLDASDAREELRDAALAAGLPETEVDRTLASALESREAA